MARPTLPPDRLAKFTAAMHHVYQFPLPNAATTTPSSPQEQQPPWTPPPCAAGHRGRYLWTDAFALLNLVTLHALAPPPPPPAPHHLAHAAALARTVHAVLGRTRDGTRRLPRATAADPLAGGLRIGKQDDEGAPDGDGQYHHYLTLWMYALSRLGAAAGGAEGRAWNGRAVRLMQAVHPAFVHDREGARPRMWWKVRVGLDGPLVRSEGNLDPVDGLVVCRVLREAGGEGVLGEEMVDYERIVRAKWEGYGSDDALDLGMTLWTAHRYAGCEEWAAGLVRRTERDLRRLIEEGYFKRDVRRRLAFREFGTVLGIRCALAHEPWWEQQAEEIMKTWEDAGVVPVPRENCTNLNASPDLVPITLVMYAAALEPGGE